MTPTHMHVPPTSAQQFASAGSIPRIWLGLQVPEQKLPLHEMSGEGPRAVVTRAETNAARSPRAKINFTVVTKRFIVGKLLS